jgi:protein-histidine pros-kinase
MGLSTEFKVLDASGDLLRVGQSERLLHGFLEAAPDAVVVIDQDGNIVRVNAQTENLFGYRREELLRQPVEVLLPERFRTRHVERRAAYVANPRPRSMGNSVELLGLRKDGREFPVDISLSPLMTNAGLLVVSAIRDMTNYRRLEDELRRPAVDLEEADRCKDQFLKTLAHELRSPLATIAQWAQVLHAPDTTAAAREAAVDVLRRQTGHMLRLVEDLSHLSRIRSGELTFRMEMADVAEVVQRATEISQPSIQERTHFLQVRLPPESLQVRGDPARLVQVFANLLTNAARYTLEGGHIALSVAREGTSAIVRVSDDGIGIPKEMLSRVFDLFTRLESGKKASAVGLGIGLALVQRIVVAHGGTVEAFSEGEGQGSEFIVHLPLAAATGRPFSALHSQARESGRET